MIPDRLKHAWASDEPAPQGVLGAFIGMITGAAIAGLMLLAGYQRIMAGAARQQAKTQEDQLEVFKESSALARLTATTADQQARRLVVATYVLAAATIGLFVSTVVLVVVTAKH